VQTTPASTATDSPAKSDSRCENLRPWRLPRLARIGFRLLLRAKKCSPASPTWSDRSLLFPYPGVLLVFSSCPPHSVMGSTTFCWSLRPGKRLHGWALDFPDVRRVLLSQHFFLVLLPSPSPFSPSSASLLKHKVTLNYIARVQGESLSIRPLLSTSQGLTPVHSHTL
jgi:hypothetical protein